jgi:hypothetical protein
MKTINRKILLFATSAVIFSYGNFTAHDQGPITQTVFSGVEQVAINPFTFDPILKSHLRPNVPQGDDKDKQEKDSDSSGTSQPVVIDSGTLA